MIVSICFGIIAIVVLAETFRLGFGWEEFQGPQAGFVPFYLGLLLLGCSIFLFQKAFRSPKKEDDTFFINRQGMMEAIRIFGTATLFSILMVYTGTYFSTIIFAMLFSRWLGKHSWVACIVFTIVTTLTIYFGMEVGLKIPLPKSALYMKGLFFI